MEDTEIVIGTMRKNNTINNKKITYDLTIYSSFNSNDLVKKIAIKAYFVKRSFLKHENVSFERQIVFDDMDSVDNAIDIINAIEKEINIEILNYLNSYGSE